MNHAVRSARPTASSRLTRRQFTGSLVAATAGVLAAPAIVRGRNLNSKLNIAVIGAGGRGSSNADGVSSENIVALCDVNENNLQQTAQRFPQARKEVDFRKLFDRPQDFDAVTVSTCEHTHALATMLALKHKKHVYCEKPLTHDVWEARQIRLAAAEAQVATQMGIQIHAGENYRRVVEIIQSGAIGPVREVHVWVSRAWGWQSKEAADRHGDIVFVQERPLQAMPVPQGLHWDLWLGPARERPFHDVYFPGPKWYRWWDFGNGTMSDLGSHFNDLPFWALKLQCPADHRRQRPASASGNRARFDAGHVRVWSARRAAPGAHDLVPGREQTGDLDEKGDPAMGRRASVHRRQGHAAVGLRQIRAAARVRFRRLPAARSRHCRASPRTMPIGSTPATTGPRPARTSSMPAG